MKTRHLLDRLRRVWSFVAPRFCGRRPPKMDENIQTHVSAIETAFHNAETFVATLPDGPLKASAVARLTAAHEAAYSEYQAFVAENPDEDAPQLRGGGTDK